MQYIGEYNGGGYRGAWSLRQVQYIRGGEFIYYINYMYTISLGAVEVLLKCGGFMYDFKNKFGVQKVMDMQENQIRTLHHWALQNLLFFQNVCMPFFYRILRK